MDRGNEGSITIAKLFTMNQVGTNLDICEGQAANASRTSYAGAANKAVRKSHSPSPSSSPSSRKLIVKCEPIYKSPDVTSDYNLHVRSNIPRTLVFFLLRKHDPILFHLALTTAVKADTYRLVQETTTGYRVDVCFQEANMEQFQQVKEQGFTFDGTNFEPVIPAPDDANIIKVSLRYLPPHFTEKELLPLFSDYGTLLQAGRYYNECGENLRAFTGAGYVLLQQTEDNQDATIPFSFDVGQHLRLQTRVITSSPPVAATKGKSAEKQDSPIKQQQSATPQKQQPQGSTSSSARPDNGRKRNRRGGRKKHNVDMEGIVATGTGTDLTDTNSTDSDLMNTAPAKASSHTRFTDPEESGNVASTQKTPPAVSLGLEQPPHDPTVKQPGSLPATTEYREHQDSSDEDDEPITILTSSSTSARLKRAAAPAQGTLGVKNMIKKTFGY